MEVKKTAVYHLAVVVRTQANSNVLVIVEPAIEGGMPAVKAVLSHNEESELRFDAAMLGESRGWSIRWLGRITDPGVRAELEKAGPAVLGLVIAAVNDRVRVQRKYAGK